jgi:hypothetical protein
LNTLGTPLRCRSDIPLVKQFECGVVAYFGYPQAHDNDADCAAHAGLAILDAISDPTSNLRTRSCPHGSASIRVWW